MLWKWYVGFMVGLIASMVVLLVLPLLGLIAFAASGIGLFVVGIVKLVYLYRTACVFRYFQI